MAKSKTTEPEQTQSPSWVQWIKNIAIGKEDSPEQGALAHIDLMDVEPTSTAILLGGNNQARSRQQIYAKYQQMLQNSFVNAGFAVARYGSFRWSRKQGRCCFY